MKGLPTGSEGIQKEISKGLKGTFKATVRSFWSLINDEQPTKKTIFV